MLYTGKFTISLQFAMILKCFSCCFFLCKKHHTNTSPDMREFFADFILTFILQIKHFLSRETGDIEQKTIVNGQFYDFIPVLLFCNFVLAHAQTNEKMSPAPPVSLFISSQRKPHCHRATQVKLKRKQKSEVTAKVLYFL